MAVPDCLFDSDDRPVFIRGYCAVFDQLRNDGHAEVLKPGCFDHVLKNPSADFSCQFHHEKTWIIGSLALDTLQVWIDKIGLCFEVGPFDVCGGYVSFLNSITSGEVRGASWSGWPSSSTKYEIVNGEHVKVIRRMRTLDHVAPTCEPAYFGTGVWLSSEYPGDMPPYLRALAESWAASRPRHDTRGALRKMARGVAALPRRVPASRVAPSRSQARAPARRPASLPLAVHEMYPAVPGLSSAELAKIAFQERKVWRMLNSKYPGISYAKARDFLCPQARAA